MSPDFWSCVLYRIRLKFAIRKVNYQPEARAMGEARMAKEFDGKRNRWEDSIAKDLIGKELDDKR